jgi:hypothetical protein
MDFQWIFTDSEWIFWIFTGSHTGITVSHLSSLLAGSLPRHLWARSDAPRNEVAEALRKPWENGDFAKKNEN